MKIAAISINFFIARRLVTARSRVSPPAHLPTNQFTLRASTVISDFLTFHFDCRQAQFRFCRCFGSELKFMWRIIRESSVVNDERDVGSDEHK